MKKLSLFRNRLLAKRVVCAILEVYDQNKDIRIMSEKLQTPVCAEAVEILRKKPRFRIVVFGASNTERYMPGIHWSDVLDVGIRSVYGRKFHVINSGLCGNNTREGLARFEDDVAAFEPDIVIVTFAGNDCNPHPPKNVPLPEFAANLDLMVGKIRALGALPILQTYYMMDLCHMESARAALVDGYMDEIRKAAGRNGVFLVDQQKYFAALPEETLRYKLLLNPMHVNEEGNILIGNILLHHLGIDPKDIVHHEKLLFAEELYRSIAG